MDASPPRHKDKDKDKDKERRSSRVRSPDPDRSVSPKPASRSPSPRTKRLRRAQADKGKQPQAHTLSHRHSKHPDKAPDKSKRDRDRSERDVDRPVLIDERDRKSERHRQTQTQREAARESNVDKPLPTDTRERRSDRDHLRERDKESAAASRGASRHARSMSPSDNDHHRHRSRHHSRSPPRSRHEDVKSREADDDANDSLLKMKAAEQALESKEKHKPSFELSGKLAAETNRVRGVTLLFTEPPDARKPDIRWRLYVFKGGEVLNEPLYVHRQSCYLFGRERRVADIPTDHPSCSKQHAVLQFRQVEKELPDGMMSKQTRPYLMDLGSTNKTFINDNPVEPQRYYELFEKDTIRFGNSSREYVLLHENSAG